MLKIKISETLTKDKQSVSKVRYTYLFGIIIYKYTYETSAIKVVSQFGNDADKQKSSGIGL